MSLVDVTVYQPDGVTEIAPVLNRARVQWRDELNTPGTGQMDVHLDDQILVDHPTLLDDRNVVVFTLGSTELKRWVIESWDRVEVAAGEKASRWVTVSGRGVLARAELGAVYPWLLSQASADTDRTFNFAAPTFVDTAWNTPVGVAKTADSTARGATKSPKPWHDDAAHWVSPTNVETSAPLGRWFFRDTFTLAAAAEVLLEASGDNFFAVWLDGERIITSDPTDPYNWKNAYQFSRTLIAGTHTIAAWIDNDGLHAGTNNPTAFIASLADTDASGNAASVLWRTQSGHGKCLPVGTSTPGLSYGAILHRLIGETQGRGVTDLDLFALGFSDTVDSNGTAWPDTQDTTIRIGTDLLAVVGRTTEVAADVWTDGMELNAAPRRGTDRTTGVIFTPGENVLAAAPTLKAGAHRNVVLIRWGSYWLEVVDPSVTGGAPRREAFLQLANASSLAQAQGEAHAFFTESAQPEITIPLQTTDAVDAVAFVDYAVGDLITGPGLLGAPASLRVYAIAGSEGESFVTFDHDLYPETW